MSAMVFSKKSVWVLGRGCILNVQILANEEFLFPKNKSQKQKKDSVMKLLCALNEASYIVASDIVLSVNDEMP